MSRWKRILWGACGGALVMLASHGAVLLSFWLRARGDGDALAQTILDRYGGLVAAIVCRLTLVHLGVGLLLGAMATILADLVCGVSSRPTGALRSILRGVAVSLVAALYLNGRLAIEKPIFLDAAIGAADFADGLAGSVARLQWWLTETFSPVGADGILAALLFVIFFRRRRDLAVRTRLAAGLLVVPFLLLLYEREDSLAESGEPAWKVSFAEAAGGSAAPGPKAGAPLNVLYLAADSLRPDHLSCNGYPRPTSPNIDRLARHAVCFDEAYVPLARTLPSWASLFTSTDPHTHGFRHMFPTRRRRRVPLATLPGLLSSAGYTSAIVADYAGECFDAIDMGFDRVDVPPSTSIGVIVERELLQRQPFLVPFIDNELGHRILPVLGFLMTNADPRRMARRVRRTIEALHQRGRPFFLTAFFSCTHIPYAVPYPYDKAFTEPGYRGSHRYGFGVLDPRALDQAMQIPDPESRRQITALYDGAVRAFDAAIGTILETLVDLGLDRRTIVVISSDHGENLYDNGNRLEHGERFGGGDAANRCTLIYYRPGDDLQARHVHDVVSTLDVMPTLLEDLGQPVPGVCRGRSLGPLLHGGSRPPRPVFAETGLMLGGTPAALAGSELEYPSILESLTADPDDGTLVLNPLYERRAVAAKERQLRTERFKLIYRPTADGARFELYDVKADPENRNDLFARPGFENLSVDLQRRLVHWMLEEAGSRLDARLHLVRHHTFFE